MARIPTLLWLWYRLAAPSLIRPLVWEPPYAMGVALEKDEKQKQKTKQKNCIIKAYIIS